MNNNFGAGDQTVTTFSTIITILVSKKQKNYWSQKYYFFIECVLHFLGRVGQYASMIREARIITIDEDGDADDFVPKKPKVSYSVNTVLRVEP